MMLRKNFETDGIFETLKKVQALGYNTFEVSQLEMSTENKAELRRAIDELGIAIPVITAGLDPMVIPGMNRASYALSTDLDQIIADCKQLGATIVRIGSLPLENTVSSEKYIEFAQRADEVAVKLKEHGIGLYYHNHNWEFCKFDGKHGIDLIHDNSTTLGFEIDVHWVWKGGVDPAKFIRSYEGRVELIHLKDYRIGMPNLELLKSDDFRAKFGAIRDVVQFAEVGEGTLDFKSIIDTSIDVGTKYFFIEQDDTYGRDIMDSLRISAENLRKLGYADLF